MSEDVFPNWCKIIFCPCYCFIYRTFKCFCDGRWGLEPYYESFSFIHNIIFFIISVADIFVLCFFFEKLILSFFIIRIISSSIGVIIFWMCFACWSPELSDEDHFDPGFLCITIFGFIITSILDLASLIIYLVSKEIDIFISISLFVHLIVGVGFLIYDISRYVCR